MSGPAQPRLGPALTFPPPSRTPDLVERDKAGHHQHARMCGRSSCCCPSCSGAALAAAGLPFASSRVPKAVSGCWPCCSAGKERADVTRRCNGSTVNWLPMHLPRPRAGYRIPIFALAAPDTADSGLARSPLIARKYPSATAAHCFQNSANKPCKLNNGLLPGSWPPETLLEYETCPSSRCTEDICKQALGPPRLIRSVFSSPAQCPQCSVQSCDRRARVQAFPCRTTPPRISQQSWPGGPALSEPLTN